MGRSYDEIDMQERYLGDSHDFIKYALLRHLNAELGVRIGVNWHLARPENVDRPGNNDGEKRHHLRGGSWQEIDPDLFEKIVGFADPINRQLSRVAEWEILPRDTRYFDGYLCSGERSAWHAAALEELGNSDLIFLDPDNGFEVASMTRRTEAKYAFFSEARDYFERGQVVVGIQFARQCDPVVRAAEVRDLLRQECSDAPLLPVVRGRVAPNILFVTVAPPRLAPSVAKALERFASHASKVELVH